MRQYPHFMFVRSVSEATQDAEGNWTGTTNNWVLHSVCREQTNGKGSLVNGQDGKAILFTSVIHLPMNSGFIAEGSEVLVSSTDSENDVRIQKQVLKYDSGQLHDRIWL